MLFDTHAHLEIVDDLEDSLKRAKEAGVSKIITIGTSLESSRKAIGMTERFSDNDLQIYATAGIHPQDGKEEILKFGNSYIDELRKIASSSDKIVGIGECGLDYYLYGKKRNIKS